MRDVNIAMLGEGFMGRTHSNAWAQIPKFFKPPVRPVMHTSCGRREEPSKAFAAQWGWQRSSSDWKEVLRLPEIELVDIVTPNQMHAEMARAAIAAGKHVACEKPLAGSLSEA